MQNASEEQRSEPTNQDGNPKAAARWRSEGEGIETKSPQADPPVGTDTEGGG